MGTVPSGREPVGTVDPNDGGMIMRAKRRRLVISILVGLALLAMPVLPAWAGHSGAGLLAAAQVEPGAGGWKTWAIESGGQFRLPPPPDRDATRAEMEELEALAAQRDAAALDRINYWDAGAPAYRWNDLAARYLVGKPRTARAVALLNVAIYDATVAAWDTKYAFNRPRPAEFQKGFATALPTPASPAYPAEHAVTAGAAATVLGYLFPADAAMFNGWAEEAGRSRLLAGTDYPSDVAAGLELGRRVGAVVVEWAKADGSDARWDGVIPAGPGKWTGTNPIEPMQGTWKTWALTSGSQFRPGPRVAFDSEQMRKELDEVKNYPRTNVTNITASYWEYFGGRASHQQWTTQASRMIFEHRLDTNPPAAARVYALMDIAFHDAAVACWDAKYAYWDARPAQLDPAITTVFVTPNHPSYPSAHSCASGAAGGVLGALFPREAGYYQALTDEIGESRIYGGIHVRSDCDAGLALGRQVAEAVMARAHADGVS
jgi:membrane-associated phospholipid phosphatase